jgi:penicillin-binding protein 1A
MKVVHRKKWLFNPFKAFGQLIALIIMICTITACIVASVMTVYVLNTLDRGDSVSLENVKLSFTTIIYGTDSKTARKLNCSVWKMP